MNELFFHECRAAGLVFKTSEDWFKWLTENSYDIKKPVAEHEGFKYNIYDVCINPHVIEYAAEGADNWGWKVMTDQAFDLRISVNTELREATENEVELFNKHYAIWKKEKEARKQPAFKTFDKVLVRLGKEFKWLPALFIRDRGESFTNRYNVLPLHTGKPADFTHCIPFEGHENIAFTDYDIENLPF